MHYPPEFRGDGAGPRHTPTAPLGTAQSLGVQYHPEFRGAHTNTAFMKKNANTTPSLGVPYHPEFSVAYTNNAFMKKTPIPPGV